MAKLSVKERDIVVDEIYSQVSNPIIEENKRLLEEAEYDNNHPYLKDLAQYEMLEDKIKKLKAELEVIEKRWRHASIEGFKLGYTPMYRTNKFIEFLKLKNVTLLEYPSKKDIEKEVILAGNSDIPSLIETIVNKFSK